MSQTRPDTSNGSNDVAASGDWSVVLTAYRQTLARRCTCCGVIPGCSGSSFTTASSGGRVGSRPSQGGVRAPQGAGRFTLVANPDTVSGVGGAGSNSRGPHELG